MTAKSNSRLLSARLDDREFHFVAYQEFKAVHLGLRRFRVSFASFHHQCVCGSGVDTVHVVQLADRCLLGGTGVDVSTPGVNAA